MFSKRIVINSTLIFCLFIVAFVYFLSPPPKDSFSKKTEIINKENGRIIKISSGMGIEEISQELKDKNFIRSKVTFKIFSFLINKARVLKSGEYDFGEGLWVPEIVNILADGPKDILVVIAPGMTIREVDEGLASLGIINKGEIINFDASLLKNDFPWLLSFGVGVPQKELTKKKDRLLLSNKGEATLEGFLFPDTYYFYPQSNTEAVIRKFLKNFEAKALPFFVGRNDFKKDITLASLLEKEIPDFFDRQIVAGILKKRINAGMPLQVDATVVYISCAGRFLSCPDITRADYKTDSSYNTYLYPGLPPLPIGNPGADAIKAAITLKNSPYWYYLSDPKTKKTIFSQTLDEHNKNRAKYLLKST
ncbi:endolytic transglycosylase MltG [Candidatus Wolfebacteria bacterium]|nr:endolytic transglycosylase MltG [Candidatus Wolfebacteria bacterium]